MNIVLNRPESQRDTRRNMDDEPGKLFIGAVGGQVTKEEFRAFFEKFGEVSDIVLMIDKETSRNRGFGFVTFQDPACASKVLESGPLRLGGRVMDPKRSVQKGQLPPAGKTPSLEKKVFVGGISQSTSEEGLRTFFNSKNLMVKDIVLMVDNQTLKSRGFGFVTFVDDQTVENVCRERFFNIDNKTVECKRAEPRGKQEMGMMGGPGGGPGMPQQGNFNQMQRGGPNMGGGPGPNMGGGFNQGWNQNPNPGFGNNQYNQGMGNYGPQGGWGGPPQQGPMGNFGQQQQQGYGPRGAPMPNQGGFGGQYNNGNAGYNQPRPQQGGYGGGYGQQQQTQPQAQQQPQQQGNYGGPSASGDALPAKIPRFDKALGPPQNYGNYGNYGQQQQQQQQQQQAPAQQQQANQARQPQSQEAYNSQAPPQPNQGYNTGNYGAQGNGTYTRNGNMGNYPQEASGYGPQRVNYNTPANPNFNHPQGTGYTGDMNTGFPGANQQQPPQPQQQQQQQPQQPQQPQQQPQQQQQQQPQQQQNYQAPNDSSNDMYSGAQQAAGNLARGGNSTALPFHPYRR